MTVDRIELVCDDPRHDPAPVDEFVRLGSVAAGYPGDPTEYGHWVTAEQLKPSGRPEPTGWRDHMQGWSNHVHSYRCGSCPKRAPQQFECTDSSLQWVLNAVAAQGMSQTTLRIINLLLSKRT